MSVADLAIPPTLTLAGVSVYHMYIYDKESFIEKAQGIHNGKYDYSKIIYKKNQKTKIKIVCPIHGEFEQRIDHHLSGCGCFKCGHELRKTIRTSNTKKWIQQ